MAFIEPTETPDPPAPITPDRTAFIGAFVTPELKSALVQEAKDNRRSISWQLIEILTKHYNPNSER